MTHRIRIETLAAGQPRPYADTIHHVRVTFDWFFAWLGNKDDPRSEWRPCSWKEEDVRAVLKALRCGFPIKEPETWSDTKLDWLKEVSPGVWEFHTTSAYTD